MPRRDRRFTGEDIARIYCANIDSPQKEIARIMMAECPLIGAATDAVLGKTLRLMAEVADASNIPLLGFALNALADAVEEPDDYQLKLLIDNMGLVGDPSA